MPPRRRFGKRLVKSFLPIVLVLALALVSSLSFIVYCVTRPTRRPYVVTPESFARISGRALKVTDEKWTNRDGRPARGWLLKGTEGAPAVVLLHRYGGDRSWLFNLGVKINEATSCTILWPELRGHGENPLVGWTSLAFAKATICWRPWIFCKRSNLKTKRTWSARALGFTALNSARTAR